MKRYFIQIRCKWMSHSTKSDTILKATLRKNYIIITNLKVGWDLLSFGCCSIINLNIIIQTDTRCALIASSFQFKVSEPQGNLATRLDVICTSWIAWVVSWIVRWSYSYKACWKGTTTILKQQKAILKIFVQRINTPKILKQ